ncbi:PLP-dependent aminotransferase family protein [Brevibacillus sp. HD3.3A]|uniref:aminotransferase-like domain-containing protein n=1 Tax=Brevibacillus sp. HD3.3A TaxID=2738979 RepID=UPI00156AD953|nr:PLP-dependent aminotransferase family protein [Brevibacillus sp. HD3.3A]UED68285.1 PLP-dependent aminotransferase family protein [Brevibacillus sp. HD3.3A]
MLTIDWKPDKAGDMPVYAQIVAYIKGKIAGGEWPINSKLPAQRALAAAFGVNRSTVVTALEELKAEGLIEATVGSGSVVCNNSWSLLATTPPPDWLGYVQSGTHLPNLPTIQEINRYEPDPRYIRLGTGELSPRLIPTAEMEDVLADLRGKMTQLGYPEPKGLLPLREAISAHLLTRGIAASPASILVVSGALQALQLISLGILHKGSTILLEQPSYLFSLPLFQSSGMRLAGVPMDEQGISPQALTRQKQLHNGALLYTIPAFHNPTSILMSEQRRRQIMATCEKAQLPILEDDVYGELWLDAPGPAPLKASDRSGLVLYMGSLSKTLSPGLRIGWIVGPQPVIERLADVKMQIDYGSSALSQWAATEWLTSGRYERHLRHIRQSLRVRRDRMCELLARWFGDLADWHVPQGGFYVWLRLRQAVSMRKLFTQALAEGILLNPGYVYDQTDSQHLRLSYAYADEAEMERALHTVAKLLRASE